MTSLVHDFDFDVIGVSETWLHPGTPSDSYLMPGYTMLRNDRQTNAQGISSEETGGGLALYIKEGIYCEQHILTDCVDPGIECLCVVLRMKGLRLGLCVVYRPPWARYTSLSALFHSIFVNLAIEVNSVIYLGDNNLDLSSKSCSEANYLRRLLREHNLVQLINEPTRVTVTSATLLDHIIVDRSVEVERTGVIDASSIRDHRGVKITDHKLIYCTIKIKKDRKEPKIITYRDFSKFNSISALTAIADIDWDSARQINGVDNIEHFISTHIRNVFDTHAPIVCKRVTKEKAPWRNSVIDKQAKLKNKLRRKYWKTRDSADWEKYKRVRNCLNSLVWRAKKAFFDDKLSTNKNPRDFWACLKQCDIVRKNRNGNIPHQLKLDDINQYFAEMGNANDVTDERIDSFRTSKRSEFMNYFNFSTVTEDTVKSAMNEIKSRAIGSDDISIEMIKAVSPYALGAITHLINESILSGSFPQRWKKSIVHPLAKVTTPKSVQQLRPISILPAISKILEKIVTRQIVEYMNEVNILPKTQSGFRKDHSTCTALVNLFSDLIDTKDKGMYSSLVMLDYSQAFDSLNHKLLIAKMHFYGFGGNSIEWVKSYLEERSQVTKIGRETSAPLVKRRGVPQGSCLGPVLFNLYTADFPSCVQSCTAHLYADDCQLHLSYKPDFIGEAIAQLNSDLVNINTWSVDNGLSLNIGKCTVLHLAPHNLVQALSGRGVRVVLDGKNLSISDTVKTLGVVLDSGLTFTDHVTHATQRALGRLRGLHRFRSLLPESAKLQLVQSLVLSVFFYCYPAYGNSISRGDVDRIQKIQNSAVRFVFNLKRSDHVSPYRDAANLFPMETVCRILTCGMVHKVILQKEPQYLSERLQFREEVSQRSTRHGCQLHFPKVKLEVGRRSFSYFGPKLYNDLPHNLKKCKIANFKSKLKEIVLNDNQLV